MAAAAAARSIGQIRILYPSAERRGGKKTLRIKLTLYVSVKRVRRESSSSRNESGRFTARGWDMEMSADVGQQLRIPTRDGQQT